MDADQNLLDEDASALPQSSINQVVPSAKENRLKRKRQLSVSKLNYFTCYQNF